jgi:hypothetical protein
MELSHIVQALCARTPAAIGAVLCDFEGETVVSALGSERAPPEAEARARDHVPSALSLTMPVSEFLVRLAAAEPCALLRLFGDISRGKGAGELAILELRYAEVEMLIQRLPNDFYLVLLLRRPAVTALARQRVTEAGALLAAHVA